MSEKVSTVYRETIENKLDRLVPGEGIEPSWSCLRRILSPFYPIDYKRHNMTLRAKEYKNVALNRMKMFGIATATGTETGTAISRSESVPLPQKWNAFTRKTQVRLPNDAETIGDQE